MASYRPYLLGSLAVLACIPVAFMLAAVTKGPPPVVLLLLAVTLAASEGGRKAGLFTTALSMAVAVLVLDSAPNVLSALADEARIAITGAVGVGISLLAGSLHTARASQRREAARLDSLIEHLPAGVIVFDAKGGVIRNNRSAREMLGYDRVPTLEGGWNVYDAAGRKLEPSEFSTALALRGEVVVGRQQRQVRPDGSETWVSVSSAPIREGDAIIGAVTTCVDIAHEKRMQFELEARRRQLQLAYESSRSGSFDFDVRTRITRWSPELEALYGMPAGSCRGTYEEWASRVHPDDLPAVEKELARAIEGGPFSADFRIRLPGGEIRHLRAQGFTWPGEDGRPAHMYGINIDVTESHAVSERLATAERRLEIALDAARMGHWHLDLVTGEMGASAAHHANFGRLPHEPLTRAEMLAAIHPDDRAAMESAVREALAAKRDYAVEYRVVWPDGTVRWIADRGRATFDAHGEPLHMDGVTIDFTGRKRLEEELRDLTRDLRDADRRKDQFLAVLGHELRNPLAPLSNAVALLRMNRDDAATRERVLSVMERQMAQVTSLVDELLDVSRIAQGKLRLEKQAVRLAELVEQAAEAVEPVVARRRHTLRVAVPEAETWLLVDRARVVQVLSNLLNNAAKYTDEGGHIELRASVAAGVAVIIVKDNGIGIPHEAQGRIFEAFSQVEVALDRSAGGLGLGLNVARRLVEMHGGTIAVHSDGPGAGSTFTVTLPLRLAAAPSAEMGSDPISAKNGV